MFAGCWLLAPFLGHNETEYRQMEVYSGVVGWHYTASTTIYIYPYIGLCSCDAASAEWQTA